MSEFDHDHFWQSQWGILKKKKLFSTHAFYALISQSDTLCNYIRFLWFNFALQQMLQYSLLVSTLKPDKNHDFSQILNYFTKCKNWDALNRHSSVWSMKRRLLQYGICSFISWLDEGSNKINKKCWKTKIIQSLRHWLENFFWCFLWN